MTNERYIEGLLSDYYDMKIDNMSENKLGFQNLIYRLNHNKEQFIFRLTPKNNRTSKQLKGELEWLLHLRKSMLVPAPIQTNKKDYFIDLEREDVPYYFTLFEFIPGVHLDYP